MTSQPNQEGSSLSAIPEMLPENLKLKQGRYARFHRLQRDKEGKTSSRIPDRASEEGYNWRKYGQKLVKGNEFIRSYYRCTHPNCQAKKQVERLQDGKITDTIYRGQHEHPKPQSSPPTSVGVVLPIQAKIPDETSLAIGEDTSSIAHPTSHQDEPTSSTIAPTDSAVEGVISQSDRTRDAVDGCGDQELKRPKKDSCDIDETPMETPNVEQNVVVHTTSEGDVVNDGYRWRKYGQKLVKGNPNPRSYYRCSTAGCPVKKHVERASDDPKVVIITYGGQHDHDMPPVRTVTPNTAGASTSITARNGEPSSRPEKGSEVGLQMVVHTSAS